MISVLLNLRPFEKCLLQLKYAVAFLYKLSFENKCGCHLEKTFVALFYFCSSNIIIRTKDGTVVLLIGQLHKKIGLNSFESVW